MMTFGRSKKRRGLIFSYKQRLIIFTFLFAFVFIWFFSYLPFWKIKKIEIYGCKNFSSSVLEKISENFIGKNFFHLDYKNVYKAIYEIPVIKKAQVFKKFLFYLVIAVEEKSPFLIYNTKEKSYIVDEEGSIISDTENFEGCQVNPFVFDKLPLVMAAETSEFLNQKLIRAEIKNVKKIISGLKEFYDPGDIRIDFQNRKIIKIYLKDSPPIFLGDDSGLTEKIDVLKKLLPVVLKDPFKIEYIDVKVPSCPVVKYLKG